MNMGRSSTIDVFPHKNLQLPPGVSDVIKIPQIVVIMKFCTTSMMAIPPSLPTLGDPRFRGNGIYSMPSHMSN